MSNHDADIARLVIAAMMHDTCMKLLSELSGAAKDAGDDALMYAANRAWRELQAAHRPVLLAMKSPAPQNPDRLYLPDDSLYGDLAAAEVKP